MISALFMTFYQGRRPLDSKKKYKVGCQKSVTKPNAENITSVRRTFGERYGDLRRQKAQFRVHPLNLPFAGCLRVTMNFRKIGGPSMCDEIGSVKKYFFDRQFFRKNIFFDQTKSKNRVEKKSSRSDLGSAEHSQRSRSDRYRARSAI